MYQSFVPSVMEQYSTAWMCSDEHLGRFQLGEVSDKAAVNVCVDVFVWTCVFISPG